MMAAGASQRMSRLIAGFYLAKIRNGLLGISTFWQGTFAGSFIIVAILFDRLRTRSANS
jgi:ribose transport system permease protein